jgi:DNA-binding response OmpR family regulator
MPHALIVEDGPGLAEMLADLIKADGFSTAAVPTLAERPQRLVLRQPAVVQLDLVLADGSRMDVFQDAAQLANTRIVIIAGNANTTSADAHNTANCGVR